MSPKKPEVGKKVLSFCGKCKEPTDHVIISMVDEEKIGKCECKTCNAKHNYRDPEKVAAAAERKTRKKKAAPTNEEVWEKALTGVQGTSKPYSMSDDFETGQLLEHSKFGKGLIEEKIGSNKIQVLFKDGVKTLICNY